jgi:hypothetical protein
MKTNRSSVTRAIAVLLMGLLLVAGIPASGQKFNFRLGRSRAKVRVNPAVAFAAALALAVGEVQKRFDEGRRTLLPTQGSDGKPAYLRQEVVDLIALTGRDLGQSIEKVQPSGAEPLLAWTDDALGRLQGKLTASPGLTAAKPAGLFAPQPVEVIASLGKPPKKKPASPKPAAPVNPPAPPPDTVAAAKADGVLDEVGKVLSQIFTLAAHNDLEVKLWVGSTAPHATFSFWPQGRLKGSPPAPTIIRTDGKKSGVLRGLYVYKVTVNKGPVTEFIEYPPPASAQATPSERLDLVNGTGFFCCRFDEHYCHAVANEKECRS